MPIQAALVRYVENSHAGVGMTRNPDERVCAAPVLMSMFEMTAPPKSFDEFAKETVAEVAMKRFAASCRDTCAKVGCVVFTSDICWMVAKTNCNRERGRASMSQVSC